MTKNPSNDISDLIVRCAREDRDALSTLYLLESSRLLGLIYTIVRNSAASEDILHDLFVRLWCKAAQFNPTDGDGRAWLNRMARNLALNAVRSVYREVSISDSPDVEKLTDDINSFEVETQLSASAEKRKLWGCLAAIDPERRTALVNAYVYGLTHAELSKHLETPLGTVKAWIQRSLVKLRECMS